MKTTILVDSDCDVFDELARTYYVRIVYLHIIYPEKDYINGVGIAAETAYQHFPREIPITSALSPQDVREVLDEIKSEGYAHVLALCIFSGLSGALNTMECALEEDTGLTSFVLDTRSISFGADILAVWTAMQSGEGRTFDELKGILPGKVRDSKVFCYMNALTYLRRGGRTGLVTSVVGNMLNIRPVISCSGDDIYYTAAKVRGAKQGLTRLLKEAGKLTGNGLCLTASFNGQGQDAADALRPGLITGIPSGTLIVEGAITASPAVHTGPGLVRIGVLHLWIPVPVSVFKIPALHHIPFDAVPGFLLVSITLYT